jgi:hypothetical protein
VARCDLLPFFGDFLATRAVLECFTSTHL